MNPVKFGTDGWRALIDKDFIPENVEKVIQAFCDWRQKIDPSRKEVVLGYDRRLKSKESAKLIAEVLAGNNFKVLISDQFCPTPCISWMVKVSDAFAGIMVTASHNPWQWNGIKFKEDYGGSASPEYTNQVEQKLIQNEKEKRSAQKLSFSDGEKRGLITHFSPNREYVGQLRNLVDCKAIKKSSWKVLFDPLFGAGAHFLNEVLGDHVDEIHSKADFKFGGLNPEPIDKNLGELMKKLKNGKWDVGLSTDGDADRIGAVDEKGNFVNSHQIFALLLKHYVEDKGLKGPIVKSVSTTQMVDLLCKKYGLECIETPIGFKHICKKLSETNALMGGEESGGISFSPHIHERDGVLNALFLLEMMSQRRKKLGELIEELYSEIGSFYFNRYDMHLEKDKIRAMQDRLRKSAAGGRRVVPSIAGKKVTSTNFVDGFKYILEDGSWILIRASGTEPLVRIYAEAHSISQVKTLIKEFLEILD